MRRYYLVFHLPSTPFQWTFSSRVHPGFPNDSPNRQRIAFSHTYAATTSTIAVGTNSHRKKNAQAPSPKAGLKPVAHRALTQNCLRVNMLIFLTFPHHQNSPPSVHPTRQRSQFSEKNVPRFSSHSFQCWTIFFKPGVIQPKIPHSPDHTPWSTRYTTRACIFLTVRSYLSNVSLEMNCLFTQIPQRMYCKVPIH